MRRLLAGVVTVLATTAAAARAQELLGDFTLVRPGALTTPAAIATDGHGAVYVAFWGPGGEIFKYTVTGEIVRVFAHRIDWVRGMAVAPDGDVHVVENGEHPRISVWTSTGEPVRTLGDVNQQLGNPTGIAIDEQGTVYVADGRDVEVFARTGGHLRSIAVGPPDARGVASAVALAPDATLWVMDANNHRVYHHAADGAFLGSFGPSGTLDGELRLPDWMAANDTGLYVSDDGSGGLYHYGFDGGFVSQVGADEVTDGGPVTADCQGTIYAVPQLFSFDAVFRVIRFGHPGVAPCGTLASDPGERLRIIVRAARRQGFARRFAVAVDAGCNRACIATASGALVIARGGTVELAPQSGARLMAGATRLLLGPSDAEVDRVIAALRRGRRVVAKLKVDVVAALGDHLRATRTVRLSL